MKVKIWGCRGSCPTPMSNTLYQEKLDEIAKIWLSFIKKSDVTKLTKKKLRQALPDTLNKLIGGNTTCIEVTSDATRLIIDLGTGVRKLGQTLAAEKKNNLNGPQILHILMTHTHWDHIQGFPFFSPAYMPHYELYFYSFFKNLEKRLMEQQNSTFFPVQLKDMQSVRSYNCLEKGKSLSILPFDISYVNLPHPGGCLSYKIKENGRTFVFATDVEFTISHLDEYIENYRSHFENADLLIMDSQYSITESLERRGWGHTAMQVCVDCAIRWKIKKIVFTHHDPAHSETGIYDLYENAKQYLKKQNAAHVPELFLAHEEDVYTL